MALSTQRRRFADEYLKGRCRNAAEAARLAGYSEKTAREQGCFLLKDDEVKAYIDEKLAEARLSANEVLALLSDQAHCSMEDFVDIGIDEERFKKLEADLEKYDAKAVDVTLPDAIRNFAQEQVVNIRDDIRNLLEKTVTLNLEKAKARNKLHLIKSLKPTQFGMSLELYDAHAALVDMGRYHKLFTDNINIGTEEKRELLKEFLRGGDVTPKS